MGSSQFACLSYAESMKTTVDWVPDNIRQLRQEQSLELTDLAQRLGDLGHNISVSSLSRLETGKRRVDVMDLMALALALEVTPSRILLPGGDPASIVSITTGSAPVSIQYVHDWAAGLNPSATFTPWESQQPLNRAKGLDAVLRAYFTASPTEGLPSKEDYQALHQHASTKAFAQLVHAYREADLDGIEPAHSTLLLGLAETLARVWIEGHDNG